MSNILKMIKNKLAGSSAMPPGTAGADKPHAGHHHDHAHGGCCGGHHHHGHDHGHDHSHDDEDDTTTPGKGCC